MLTMTSRMADVPVGLKPRMRELTLGAYEPWGFWGWTFHDGSTWAALGFDGDTTRADRLVGWAGLTQQIDVLPVVGVYVAEQHRSGRRAELLVTSLLRYLVAGKILHPGSAIAAATQRWSRYREVVESCGLKCETWA